VEEYMERVRAAGKSQNISRKGAKAAKNKILKHEIRNSKQIQMIEKHKIQNILDSDSVFWIFRV
jgi:hypothetical protein